MIEPLLDRRWARVALAAPSLALWLAATAMTAAGETPNEAAPGAAGAGRSSSDAALTGVAEDKRLAQRVEQRLAWDAELARYPLDVNVNAGIANLSGSVSTLAESHLARRIASDTQGIAGVVNGLYVDPTLRAFAGSAPKPPDDATLAERARITLARDPDLADESIQVEVADGVVRLTGAVQDYTSDTRAARVIESLYGVERVVTELEVSGR